MITGAQVREARKLLKWSQLQLGYKAGLSDATIVTFEAAQRPLLPKNVQAIRKTLESAGIEFDDSGQGVRLRKGKP